MRNRIAWRLMAFFAAALLLFALVSGMLFGSLFHGAVVENKKAEMLSRAGSLAQSLSSQLGGNAPGGRGMGGPGGGYGAAVRLLTQSLQDVWVLDENLQVLSSGRMMGKTLAYDSLPPDAERLVREVFDGKQPFSEGFSDMVGYPTLTVGVPILQDGRVAGALLIHDAVSGISQAAAQGQKILLYAGAAALLLAIPLAALLSIGFTRPIRRMETVARRLADGDYQARTGLHQKDEIGELAQSIDSLSVRLQEARDADERQEQQRRDFLASVAHELRTPVTVLRGSLEALVDGVVAEPDKVAGYHRQMLGETHALQRLVNDLMELARLQNADFPIERAPLMLDEVLRDALRSAERLAQNKSIAISRPESLPAMPIYGDYARLKQMLLIVLDNAVKFSPKGSRVTVLMDKGHIRISDQGPGISAEDLPHVFDRFHKSNNAENRQGSGLGLAIARQIALRHGMGITLSSEPGVGTTVTFSLPDPMRSAAP